MKKRKVVWKVIALSALIILLLLMIGFVIYLERYQPEEVLLEINNTVPSTEAAPALDTVQPPYSIAETEVQSPSTTEATVPAGLTPTLPEESEYEDVAVDTPYCTLYYSGKWQDSIQIEVKEEDFGCGVEFYGFANEQKVFLFSFLFALETENSYPIGYYESEDGITLDVSMELSDFVPDDTWSEEAVDLICSMQEEVNYVINKLSSLPGFHSAE